LTKKETIKSKRWLTVTGRIKTLKINRPKTQNKITRTQNLKKKREKAKDQEERKIRQYFINFI